MRRMGGVRAPTSDTYADGPAPDRPVIAALVVVALLVGIGLGVVVARLAGPGHAAAPAVSRPGTTGVPGAGASRTVQGIPIGYPHTPQGAADAAGNYLAILGGPLALNTGASRAALDQVADPGTRTQLEQGLAGSVRVEEALWGIQTAARQGRHVLLTQTPIAYQITSYTPQAATVAVWLVTNVGVENRQRLAAFFGNGSAIVVWLDGDWRLHAIDNGSQAGDVVPACLQTPTQTGGVPAKLEGYVPYGG